LKQELKKLKELSAVSGNNNFWTSGRVKVVCHFPFWERKFYVIFAPGSESTWEQKFLVNGVTNFYQYMSD